MLLILSISETGNFIILINCAKSAHGQAMKYSACAALLHHSAIALCYRSERSSPRASNAPRKGDRHLNCVEVSHISELAVCAGPRGNYRIAVKSFSGYKTYAHVLKEFTSRTWCNQIHKLCSQMCLETYFWCRTLYSDYQIIESHGPHILASRILHPGTYVCPFSKYYLVLFAGKEQRDCYMLRSGKDLLKKRETNYKQGFLSMVEIDRFHISKYTEDILQSPQNLQLDDIPNRGRSSTHHL